MTTEYPVGEGGSAMFRWTSGRDPFHEEFERLRREMGSLFDLYSSGRRPWLRPLFGQARLFPLLNVTDTREAFVVTAEIPGMKTEDLEIKIEGDTLRLKGERKPQSVDDEASYHRRERATGAFQRSLTLPGKVDPDKVNATYKNGVLIITLSKEKEALPKQITVETG
jgi:HSP20 family protein